MFPYDFNLYYGLTLHGNTVKIDYKAVNTGTEDFDFTAALHSYFQVGSLPKSRVLGLKGLTYLDKVNNHKDIQKYLVLLPIN